MTLDTRVHALHIHYVCTDITWSIMESFATGQAEGAFKKTGNLELATAGKTMS